MTTIAAYKTAPQQERKAAAELRRARIRAYVPMEKRSHRAGFSRKIITRSYPLISGIVCAPGKPHDAFYVRKQVGVFHKRELNSLYAQPRIRPTKAAPRFVVGAPVVVNVGHTTNLPAYIAEVLANGYFKVQVELFGKKCYPRIHQKCISAARHNPP